ncbi:hypothetical protein R50912_03745 [Paenibacillus sp. FSL R5-0912]|nr:hypothetical protein R50912_03745 [Paenibacillus sp. FSL R5-0912]
MNDATEDSIAVKIHNQYVQKVGRVSMGEINAWKNSMNYFYKVLNTDHFVMNQIYNIDSKNDNSRNLLIYPW